MVAPLMPPVPAHGPDPQADPEVALAHYMGGAWRAPLDGRMARRGGLNVVLAGARDLARAQSALCAGRDAWRALGDAGRQACLAPIRRRLGLTAPPSPCLWGVPAAGVRCLSVQQIGGAVPEAPAGALIAAALGALSAGEAVLLLGQEQPGAAIEAVFGLAPPAGGAGQAGAQAPRPAPPLPAGVLALLHVESGAPPWGADPQAGRSSEPRRG